MAGPILQRTPSWWKRYDHLYRPFTSITGKAAAEYYTRMVQGSDSFDTLYRFLNSIPTSVWAPYATELESISRYFEKPFFRNYLLIGFLEDARCVFRFKPEFQDVVSMIPAAFGIRAAFVRLVQQDPSTEVYKRLCQSNESWEPIGPMLQNLSGWKIHLAVHTVREAYDIFARSAALWNRYGVAYKMPTYFHFRDRIPDTYDQRAITIYLPATLFQVRGALKNFVSELIIAARLTQASASPLSGDKFYKGYFNYRYDLTIPMAVDGYSKDIIVQHYRPRTADYNLHGQPDVFGILLDHPELDVRDVLTPLKS